MPVQSGILIRQPAHLRLFSTRKIRSFFRRLFDSYLTAVRMTTDLERFLQDSGILIGREKRIICSLFVNEGSLFCERLMKITCESKPILVRGKFYL